MALDIIHFLIVLLRAALDLSGVVWGWCTWDGSTSTHRTAGADPHQTVKNRLGVE